MLLIKKSVYLTLQNTTVFDKSMFKSDVFNYAVFHIKSMIFMLIVMFTSMLIVDKKMDFCYRYTNADLQISLYVCAFI